jgi:uncharacterized protein
MSLSIVVSDTSPLRALAHLDLLVVLEVLFGHVVVPPAVDTELLQPPLGLPRVDVRTLNFVRIQAPSDLEAVQKFMETLDPGESEAQALALELSAKAILIDEAAGRAVVRRLGLLPIGVLGILVRAKQRGLVSAGGRLIDRLRGELGFFISAALKDEILRNAGEC